MQYTDRVYLNPGWKEHWTNTSQRTEFTGHSVIGHTDDITLTLQQSNMVPYSDVTRHERLGPRALVCWDPRKAAFEWFVPEGQTKGQWLFDRA